MERRLNTYQRPDRLILDDFGLKPLQTPGPEDLYDVINERFEKGSILLTSNRAPAEWPDLFLNPLLASAGLDRRLVLELSQSLWIDKARNIIVSGATGTGKTFLSSAFGYAACKLGYSVRYYRTARFLHDFNIANRNETFLSMLKSLSKVDLLILDDWMHDPIQLSAAQSLLELFDDRFGHTSTIIVSQVPVSEWHTRFPDPTLAIGGYCRLSINHHFVFKDITNCIINVMEASAIAVGHIRQTV